MDKWLPVVDFEGLYEVSDAGNVRRIAPWCDGRPIPIRGELTGKITRSGYRRVSLHRSGKPREFAVHRLVLAAFIGPLPSFRHQVNHKNGVRSDNRVENLEYLTPSENQFHAWQFLGRTSRPGSKHHNAKITESDVVLMRKLRSSGKFNCIEIAARFGISQPQVCDITNYKAWTHVKSG